MQHESHKSQFKLEHEPHLTPHFNHVFCRYVFGANLSPVVTELGQ